MTIREMLKCFGHPEFSSGQHDVECFGHPELEMLKRFGHPEFVSGQYDDKIIQRSQNLLLCISYAV